MSKLKRIRFSQYSDESVNLKVRIIYILKILFKISILSPLVLSITEHEIVQSNPLILPLIIVASILIPIISSKNNFKEDKYFLDDRVVVSNKTNKRGDKEDVTFSKFSIIILSLVFFIIPFLFILSLSISTILTLALNIFNLNKLTIFIFKYLITLFIFNKIFKISSSLLIKNVKSMKSKNIE